jgi:hypothetical protein
MFDIRPVELFLFGLVALGGFVGWYVLHAER